MKIPFGTSLWKRILTDQVDQGVLLLLASDGLGRPLAALILSDVPPKRDEDHWEEKEEVEVNNATEKQVNFVI